MQFVVASDRTDVQDGDAESFSVRLLTLRRKTSLHWSIQAAARISNARALVKQVPPGHDLFISCQPEMVCAHRRIRPATPIVYVCGGTSLLNEPFEAQAARRAAWPARLSRRLDRHLRRRNERLAMLGADRVVFDSFHTRRLVVETYAAPSHCCHTIHGGVDPEQFRPPTADERLSARNALGIHRDEFTVAWTGRLSPEKNLPLIFSALEMAPDVGRLLLVGDGPQRSELEALARRFKVADRITFAGMQSDVRRFLHAADAFVFPSSGESFGGSLIEAMACGLPCLLARPGDTVRNAADEIIGNAGCARTAPADAASFAGILTGWVNDYAERRDLGRRARQRAVACFTWNAARLEFTGLVRSLMRLPSSRRQWTARRGAPAELAVAAR